MGFSILLTATVSEVFVGIKEVSRLVTKIIEFEVAVQEGEPTDPPNEEVTKTEQDPLAMYSYDGKVILIAAPVVRGFLINTVKL